MNKNIGKCKFSFVVWKWLGFSFLAIVIQFFAIFSIMQADFLADNIKFLLDDPYIYWISGWVLFVPALLLFSCSIVKFIKFLIQYFKSFKSQNTNTEVY